MKIILISILSVVLFGSISATTPNVKLSPVIFVPGYGGSQLEARLDKETSSYLCVKKSKWYNIWLNLQQLIPGIVNCWIDNVRLYYDAATRTTHNTNGVDIRVPGWGNPEVVEWINPTHNKGAYFKDIANALVNKGYTRGKSIRGAPFDFRKAPNELKDWFLDLKQLVEETYEKNNGNPVTFISHSMGSPMTLVFLQKQTDDWKQKYISKVISLAGAWGGSVKAVKVFAMGDDLDFFALSGKTLRTSQVSNPSTAYLLPSPLFWGPNEVLAETPSRKYTMSKLQHFLHDVDTQTGWEMRKDNIKYSLNFSPPDVEMHCLYGIGKSTVERLVYKSDILSAGNPTLVKGDGDGTVNARSLRACTSWIGYQSRNITNLELTGLDHLAVLSNSTVIDYILSVL